MNSSDSLKDMKLTSESLIIRNYKNAMKTCAGALGGCKIIRRILEDRNHKMTL